MRFYMIFRLPPTLPSSFSLVTLSFTRTREPTPFRATSSPSALSLLLSRAKSTPAVVTRPRGREASDINAFIHGCN